jgi:tetratricopeptide (TPR) repeat protein
MKCPVAHRLHDLLDGLLTQEEASAVKAHLEECLACQDEEDRLRNLLRETAKLPKQIEPPPHVWERVTASISALAGSESANEDVPQIPDAFLSRLAEAIALRHSERCTELLAPYAPDIDRVNPGQKNAARLLAYFAQWVDMGFYQSLGVEELFVCNHLKHLKSSLSRLTKSYRADVSAPTYALLRFSEGCVALLEGALDKAIVDLQVAVGMEEVIGDSDTVTAANWFLARAHIGKGEYDLAFLYINRAEEIARKSGRAELLAVIQTSEGWLHFQRGEREQALRVFEKATPVLAVVRDHRSLGFIAASRGRIAKRDGLYVKALDYFTEALNEYEHEHGPSPNPDKARALVSMAFVKYLLSRRCRHNERDKAVFCKEALAHLIEAEEIFKRYSHEIGEGLVNLTRTFLHIQGKELALAESEVRQAYQLGTQNENSILIARASLLQCKIETLKAQDNNSPSACHLERALGFANEAIQQATKTQNRRLRAKAYIWCGLTLVSEYFNDLKGARKCYDEADRLLKPKGGDNVRDHFDLLGSRLGLPSSPAAAPGDEPVTVFAQTPLESPYDL